MSLESCGHIVALRIVEFEESNQSSQNMCRMLPPRPIRECFDGGRSPMQQEQKCQRGCLIFKRPCPKSLGRLRRWAGALGQVALCRVHDSNAQFSAAILPTTRGSNIRRNDGN